MIIIIMHVHTYYKSCPSNILLHYSYPFKNSITLYLSIFLWKFKLSHTIHIIRDEKSMQACQQIQI